MDSCSTLSALASSVTVIRGVVINPHVLVLSSGVRCEGSACNSGVGVPPSGQEIESVVGR